MELKTETSVIYFALHTYVRFTELKIAIPISSTNESLKNSIRVSNPNKINFLEK